MKNEQADMAGSVRAPARAPGTGPRPAPASRLIRRRAALPTGRAVAGGFLIAVAALGIFVAYTRAVAGPTERYAVARHDIVLGARLSAGDLVLLPMQLPDMVAKGAAFSSARQLEGATVVGPIRRGELVQTGDVIRKRSGATEFEVSFPIESARALAGALRPGERVDVLATYGGGPDSYTVAVVRHARVLDTSRSGRALDTGRTETVTLALGTPEEALAVTHAVNAGEIILVRSTGTQPTGEAGRTYRAPAADKAKNGGG